MIASLKGHLHILSLNALIVDVNGVGYHLHVPIGTAGRVQPEADGRVSFHIHTSVREDAISLYGFATYEEKRLFMRLTSVSGIGPKMGLAVLSGLSPSDFIRAVRNSDVKALTQISGVGKKTAQRIILELKSAVDDFDFAELAPPERGVQSDMAEDLRSALENLGYRENDVEQTLADMQGSIENAADLEALLREALKMLR